MKYIIYFCLLATITLAQSNRTLLSSFVVTTLVLKDSSLIAENSEAYIEIYNPMYSECTDIHFLSESEFKRLMQCLFYTIQNPGKNIYTHPDSLPADASRLYEQTLKADTLLSWSFDESGNEVKTAVWACEDFGKLNDVNKVELYMALYFNTSSQLIEPEVYGYSLWEQFENHPFRPLLYIFKDQQTALQVKPHLLSGRK